MSDDVSQPCEREHHDATITILSKKKFVYIYIFLYTSLVASTLILHVAANAVIQVFFFFFCNACITYYFVIITVCDFFRNQ